MEGEQKGQTLNSETTRALQALVKRVVDPIEADLASAEEVSQRAAPNVPDALVEKVNKFRAQRDAISKLPEQAQTAISQSQEIPVNHLVVEEAFRDSVTGTNYKQVKMDTVDHGSLGKTGYTSRQIDGGEVALRYHFGEVDPQTGEEKPTRHVTRYTIAPTK